MMMLLLAACLPIPADPDRIAAGDLAAAEAIFSALAPDTVLGYAPAPGVRRTFGIQELARIAHRYGLSSLPQAEICVERPVAPLDRAKMLEAMIRSLGLPDARIEIVEHSRYPVPQGEVEFPRASLVAPPVAQTQAAALWKGSIRYGGNRGFSIWARVRITVKSARVVAAEPLAAQRPIAASQLRVETYEGFPARTPPLAGIGQAVGRIPRRRLPAGAALTAGDLDTPYEITRGDPVRVAVSHGEAHLELDGRAEASGRRGQTIPVLNPATGKKFNARVDGAGHVSVGAHP